MYKEYFGLREAPFSITPDPRYVYMSLRHQEALAHLLYGTGEEGGFVQLTGEVGTGKTTLVRVLLEQELGETDVALIIHPRLTLLEFVATICDELGAIYPTDATTLKPLIDALNRHLLRSHAKGRQTVVIVDEAQNLVPEVLEQVRLLTNLETAKHKLLRIILVGQPELKEVLERHDMRQLSQRITARCHLDPLSRAEVAAYVTHRLEVAGGRRDIFSPAALRTVHAVTGGIPRLINVVCDRALLGAYTESARQVEPKMVKRAATEAFGKPPGIVGNLSTRQLAAATLVLLLVGGGVISTYLLEPDPGVTVESAGTEGQTLAEAQTRSTEDAAGRNTAQSAGDPAVDSADSSKPVTAEGKASPVAAGDGAETVALAAVAGDGGDGPATYPSEPDASERLAAMPGSESAGAESSGADRPRAAAPISVEVPATSPGAAGTETSSGSRDFSGVTAEPSQVASPDLPPQWTRVPTQAADPFGESDDLVVDLRSPSVGSEDQIAKLTPAETTPAAVEADTEVIDLRGLSPPASEVELIDLRGSASGGRERVDATRDGANPDADATGVLSFQALAREVAAMRTSQGDMFDRLFELWGVPSREGSTSNPCIDAYGLGMRCLEGQAAWTKLRRWNRPALIWLQAGEAPARPALLQELGGNTAAIDMGVGRRTVRISDLEAFWTGQILMVWKLQSSVALIGLGSTGQPVQWLHERLNLAEGLPMESGTPPSAFDASMQERVIDYQRRHGLSADGIVGQHTMIELNNLAPARDTPRLVR